MIQNELDLESKPGWLVSWYWLGLGSSTSFSELKKKMNSSVFFSTLGFKPIDLMVAFFLCVNLEL